MTQLYRYNLEVEPVGLGLRQCQTPLLALSHTIVLGIYRPTQALSSELPYQYQKIICSL